MIKATVTKSGTWQGLRAIYAKTKE